MSEKGLVMAMQGGNRDTKNERKNMASFTSWVPAVIVGFLAYVIIIYGPDIVRGVIILLKKE